MNDIILSYILYAHIFFYFYVRIAYKIYLNKIAF